jgi:large subunit ribosomal protein L29
MTALKSKNLRSETIEELRERELTLRKELYDLRVKASSGAIDKPHRMREIKRDIARILTILKEKQNAPK